ncbi:MAG: hypothetical protein ISS17_07470 [Bacteroidales bacterium]|nr:hypothetical protein [Bacteroidales bacterium]
MKIVNTSPLPRSISSLFPGRIAGTLAEVLFLLFLGMLAMVIHAKLRIPLQLPGRQGVIFLTLIILGRGVSQFPFAGTIACTGSALILATSWLGFREPLAPVVYILIGVILDLLYLNFSKVMPFVLATALSCAIGWMFIPLIKFGIASITGLIFTSFRFGIAWPLATHLLFGLAGGLLGASIVKLSAHLLKKE